MIIGIAGYARHGKDSVCEELLTAFEKRGKTASRYAFADPLKAVVNKFMGWGKKEAYGSKKEEEVVVSTSYRVIQKALDLHVTDYMPVGIHPTAERFVEVLKEAGIKVEEIQKQRTTELLITISPRKAYQLFGTEYIRSYSKTFWFELAQAAYESSSKDYLIIPDLRFKNEYNWVEERGLCLGVHRPNMRSNGVGTSHTSEKDIEWILSNCERTVINSGTLKDLTPRVEAIADWILSLEQ